MLQKYQKKIAEINLERERVSKFRAIKPVDMDNLFKSLEASFSILTTLPSMHRHFVRKLKQEMKRFDGYLVDEYDSEIREFQYFVNYVSNLASLTKQGDYQEIINKLNVKLTGAIIIGGFSIALLAAAIFFATVGFYAVFPAVGFFIMSLGLIAGAYSELSERKENNLALIDVRAKLDNSSVKNTTVFFAPKAAIDTVTSNDKISSSIGNSVL